MIFMVTEKSNIQIKKFSLIIYFIVILLLYADNNHDFDSNNVINFDFLNLNDLGVIIFL